MNKKIPLVEHFKTAILVVLFFITILLLYLCLNQSGNDFTISEIIPGGRTNTVTVNVDNFISAECLVETKASGKYEVCFSNTAINKAIDECAGKLLASSALNISSSSLEDLEEFAFNEKSIIVFYSFDMPFKDYCNKVLGKTIESNENIFGFNTIVFSDKAKECMYFLDSKGNTYKVSSGENYYSTDRIGKELESKSSYEFSAEDFFVLKENALSKKKYIASETIEIDKEEIAKNIFGENFDFVRKITDKLGNETYMYGYGQKRLSIYSDSKIEFKEDIAQTNPPDFYQDLENSLLNISKILGIDLNSLRLTAVNKTDADVENYSYEFTNDQFVISIELKDSKLAYFKLEER